jgi:phosphoribosyl 1,2-cyclic phosphodiesterase
VQPSSGVPPIILDLGTGCRTLGERLVERYFPGCGLAAGAPNRAAAAAAGAAGASAPGAGPGSAESDPPPSLRLAAFVTHLHFDHVQGFPFFGPALRPGVRLEIHGPAQDGRSLAEAFACFVQPPYFPVGVGDLPAELSFSEMEDRDEVKVDGALVRAREVPHVGRTLGYRVECEDAVVAYVGDHCAPSKGGYATTAVPESVLSLADGADLLVHDAQYTEEEFKVKAHWGHSTVAYAVNVAKEAGVSRLALFHHDPTHDDDWLDRLGEEATKLAGSSLEVQVAAENTTITLG